MFLWGVIIIFDSPPISDAMNRICSRLLLCLFLLPSVACKNYKLKRQVQTLYNAEITIPACLAEQVVGKIPAGDVPMMIVYYDSLDCVSCSLKRLNEWDGILRYYADSLEHPVASLFIFAPADRDREAVKFVLKNYGNYPVVVDESFDFVKANPVIPPDKRLHAFLLDAERHVVTIGSPQYDDRIWNLYKQTLHQLKTR